LVQNGKNIPNYHKIYWTAMKYVYQMAVEKTNCP
jgi:hypothetical protein